MGSEFLALVIPQEDRRDAAWSLVLLRNDVLTGKLIPALVERYCGAEYWAGHRH